MIHLYLIDDETMATNGFGPCWTELRNVHTQLANHTVLSGQRLCVQYRKSGGALNANEEGSGTMALCFAPSV